MKKKIILILTSAILSIGVISFALISGRDETNYVKAKDEPYTLNLSSLSSSNNTLTTSNGNNVTFEVSGYSDGSFSNNSYIKNTSPISGIESLTITFETSSADLTISYGWYANNYYSTDGVINSSSNTYYFDEQGPSYFKIENKSGGQINVTSIQLSYSCSETAAPGVKYTLVKNGTASYYSVSGYNSQLVNAVILPEYKGKPVTEIGISAFQNCSSLVSVTIPDSITSICSSAFQNCTSLISVTIPNSVWFIGASAFSSCSSLSSIVIPEGVTSINGSAFAGCSSLTSVSIPNGVKYIWSYTFYNCSSLATITIPQSVKTIEDDFSGCSSLLSFDVDNDNEFYSSLDGVLFNKERTVLFKYPSSKAGEYCVPNGVVSIDDNAFSVCSKLTSVTLPDSVTSIGDQSFYGCSSMQSLTIGSSVTSIGDWAFYNCSSLISIDIPDSVTSIGDSAFRGCSSLTSIVIPDSVTSIGYDAFYECSSLISATLGTGITSIGYAAFGNCSSLQYNEYDHCYYLGNSINPYVYLVRTPYDYSTYDIPSGCKIIAPYSLAGSKLTSLVIPDSVISIGSLGGSSLQYNEYDNGYYLGNSTNPYLALIKAKNTSITSCEINSNCKIIIDSSFENCSLLENIVIPDSVISLGERAFYYCSSMASVTIGNSVTSISDNAFDCCSKLTSVILGNSVTSIGDYAFYGCSSLTSINIPNSVTSIGKSAFHYCSSLAYATIGNGVISIDYCAFYGCSKLTSATIGNNVISIGELAFYNCSKLASIIIPLSVTSIKRDAFENYSYTIYCEANSKPSGWYPDWNSNKPNVVWGYTPE